MSVSHVRLHRGRPRRRWCAGFVGVLAVLLPPLLLAPAAWAAPAAGTAGAAAVLVRGRNLLANPGFERIAGRTGQPAGWVSGSWTSGSSATVDARTSHGGRRSARLDSPDANDVWWAQTVTVTPYTRYELSGWIRTRGVERSEQAAGANIGLLGRWDHTPGVFGTTGWQRVGMSFGTRDETSLTIAARLGYWSGTTRGTAWFDDLTLSAVSVPGVARWKVLVELYPTVDVTIERGGATRHVIARATPAELRAAADSARAFFRQDVPALTTRLMVPAVTVRTASRALTRLDAVADAWWPGPGVTAPEREPSFDAMVVIWPATGIDQETGASEWLGHAAGLAIDTGTAQTYTSIILDAAVAYGHRNVFKHEFGHNLLSFFQAAGTSPQPGVTNHAEPGQYVHCGTGAPYVWVDETLADPVPNSIYHNESGFTHDYYSGTTALASDPQHCLGITPAAWRSGGPSTYSRAVTWGGGSSGAAGVSR